VRPGRTRALRSSQAEAPRGRHSEQCPTTAAKRNNRPAALNLTESAGPGAGSSLKPFPTLIVSCTLPTSPASPTGAPAATAPAGGHHPQRLLLPGPRLTSPTDRPPLVSSSSYGRTLTTLLAARHQQTTQPSIQRVVSCFDNLARHAAVPSWPSIMCDWFCRPYRLFTAPVEA